MFGFFVSHFRGRSVAAADSFIWLYENSRSGVKNIFQYIPFSSGSNTCGL